MVRRYLDWQANDRKKVDRYADVQVRRETSRQINR
jgi:hypothetical protein